YSAELATVGVGRTASRSKSPLSATSGHWPHLLDHLVGEQWERVVPGEIKLLRNLEIQAVSCSGCRQVHLVVPPVKSPTAKRRRGVMITGIDVPWLWIVPVKIGLFLSRIVAKSRHLLQSTGRNSNPSSECDG